jgi:hypothetical protein
VLVIAAVVLFYVAPAHLGVRAGLPDLSEEWGLRVRLGVGTGVGGTPGRGGLKPAQLRLGSIRPTRNSAGTVTLIFLLGALEI